MFDTAVDDGRARVVPHIARLRDGTQERPEACAALVCELVLERDGLRIVEIRIVEHRGSDKAFVAALSGRQGRKVMKNQDVVTTAVRDDLEASAVPRKRIGPHGPGVRWRRRGSAE